MNTTVRPPGPLGVALPRNRDLGSMGHPGWGQDWQQDEPGSQQTPPACPIPSGMLGSALVPSQSSWLLLDPSCSAGKRWKEEENSVARDGKGKNRFGASSIHPISSTPTAMVSAAQPKPNTEDSHGKSVATTPAVPGVKSLSIPKVSEAGSSCDVS